MKPTTKTMFAAAALLAAAATASAETYKAEIPFAFSAGQGRLHAGTYDVRVNHGASGNATVQIYNRDERRSVLAMPMTLETPVKRIGSDAVLSFACTDGNCVLARIWDGSATLYTFKAPKPGSATRMATVVVRPDHAE